MGSKKRDARRAGEGRGMMGGKGAVLCIDDGFIHLSVRFTADSE